MTPTDATKPPRPRRSRSAPPGEPAGLAATPADPAPDVAADRLLDPDPLRDESMADVALRPHTLDEYVGQDRMKDNLRVFIQAARARGEPLDHVLLYGPPGLGKTTIAHILAGAMQTGLRSTSGPALERAGDLAAILTNLEGCGVLFIDEIHRLPVALEEILYQAMEDFRLDVVIGQGPGARTVKIDLLRFTLVGATTRIGLLSGPLRDRFGIVHHLDFYPVEDLVRIVRRSSGLLGVPIEEAGGAAIARRARGTPRVANRLLRRVRDFVQVDAERTISGEVADRYLERLEVDRFGLDSLDRKILLTSTRSSTAAPSASRPSPRRSGRRRRRSRRSTSRISCRSAFSIARRAAGASPAAPSSI
jgi:Holliday junction DNA helicase RuvB